MSIRIPLKLGFAIRRANAADGNQGRAGPAISGPDSNVGLGTTAGGLGRFLHLQWPWFTIGCVLLVLRSVAELAKPLPLAYAIESVVDEGGLGQTETENLAWAAGFVVAFTVLERAFRFLAGIAFRHAGAHYAAELRRTAFEHLQFLQLSGANPPSGRTNLGRVLSSVQAAFGDNLRQAMSAVLVLAGMAAIALYMDLQVGSLVIVLAVPFYVLTRRHNDHVLKMRADSGAAAAPETATPWTMEVLAAAAIAVVLITAGYRAQQGFIGVGQLFVLLYYTQALFAVLRNGVRNGVEFRQVFKTTEELTASPDAPVGRKAEQAARAPRLKGAVELHEIAVGEHMSLRTTIHIADGAITAIEGAPRALSRGLIMAVLRHGKPGDGTVLIDGHDTSMYDAASVRAQVGVLLREPVLLDASIAENIACGRSGLRQPEIEAAAQLTGAHAFIATLPEGYNTELADVQDKLTAAEKQLIAVTRAAAQDAPFLILEEPTYGLATGSAEPVVSALKSLLHGRTALMLTHDRDLLAVADHRIRLEDVSIALEEGAAAAEESVRRLPAPVEATGRANGDHGSVPQLPAPAIASAGRDNSEQDGVPRVPAPVAASAGQAGRGQEGAPRTPQVAAALGSSSSNGVSHAGADSFGTLLGNRYRHFALTRQQFERLLEERPELVVIEGNSAVVGFPYRDYLVVHYSLPDLDAFVARFPALFGRCVSASNDEEAPRGTVVRFHDRFSRSRTDSVFASLKLLHGPEWTQMVLKHAPAPSSLHHHMPAGYGVRVASPDDLEVIGELEMASGLKPLTENGLWTLAQESRTGQIVTDGRGQAVGFFNLRMAEGSVGILEPPILHPTVRERLAEPVLHWSLRWLCDQGALQFTATLDTSNSVMMRALKGAGFVQGQAGLTYTRDLA
jgi:ABC-type multidrug transport system fused ATPase/permease subunit